MLKKRFLYVSLSSLLLANVSPTLVLATEDSSPDNILTTEVVDDVLMETSEEMSITSTAEDIVLTAEEKSIPTYIYGGGLTETEALKLLKDMGFEYQEDVRIEYITGEDMGKYTGHVDDTSSLISSVVLLWDEDTKGISVEIATPENITLITPMQYQKAAMSLGVENVKIVVGSPTRVTGESALGGVYKALDMFGHEFTQGQVDVANAETDLFADIVEQGQNLEDFNPDDFTLALAELQKQVKELKDKQEDFLSEEQIRQLILDILKEKGLDTVLTEENINKLVALIDLYQNTPEIIDSELISEQADMFISTLEDNLAKGWNYVKDGMENFDTEQAKGIWASVVDFFKGVFEWFGNLFSKDDSETELVGETKESDSGIPTNDLVEENPAGIVETEYDNGNESSEGGGTSGSSGSDSDTVSYENPEAPVSNPINPDGTTSSDDGGNFVQDSSGSTDGYNPDIGDVDPAIEPEDQIMPVDPETSEILYEKPEDINGEYVSQPVETTIDIKINNR